MKVLIATKNKIKIAKISTILKEKGIEYITLRDLEEEYDVREDGDTTLENATFKARFYHELTGMSVIATDSSMYIDGLPKKDQIGLFAGRKIIYDELGNIKEEIKLTDDENFKRIGKIIDDIGGKAKGRFVESFVFIDACGNEAYKNIVMPRNFKTPASNVRKENAPARSYVYYDKIKKYRSELTDDEANEMDKEAYTELQKFINRCFDKQLPNYKIIFMKENFNLLTDRILDSNEKIDYDQIREILKNIKGNTISIGEGGSASVSYFGARVIEGKNNLLAIQSGSRDFLNRDPKLFQNMLAFTFGGNNYGVNMALDAFNDKKVIFTSNPDIVKNIRMDDKTHIINLKTNNLENSFVSLASTMIPMTALLEYALDGKDSAMMNVIILNIEEAARRKIEEINKNYDLTSNVFEIMSGDNTYTASKTLESNMVESGVGIPLIHEKYGYCHGRSVLASENKNEHTLIYLLNNKKELDETLFGASYLYKNVIVLDCNDLKSIVDFNNPIYDSILGEYYLTMQAMYLSKSIAEQKNKDLSRVNYPDIVRTKLYKYKGGM